MLDLLELGLGSSADLDDGNATGELGQALLELLTVEVRGGVLHLTLDLSDTSVDGLLGASAADDDGIVLGDGDGLSGTEHIGGDVSDLHAQLVQGSLAAGEDGDVLEDALAAIAVARGLDGADVEGATDLVEDQGRQSLAIDVLSDDEQATASALDSLENGHNVLNAGDLLVGDEDVRILHHGLHAVVIRDEVSGDIALVELHALDGVDGDVERLGILDGDDAVLAHDLHGLGDLLADLGVTGGDGTDGSNLLLGLDRLGLLLHLGDGGVDGLVDAATDGQRVGASGDVAQAVVDDSLSEQGCGGGAVTHGVVGLGGDLLHQLGTHVLDVVLELNLLGDGNAVVGDGRGTKRALQSNVATLGAHGDGNGVGQSVDTLGELSAGIGVERNVLCHGR